MSRSLEYRRGHTHGASKAKSNAARDLRKAFKIPKKKIEGTTPNERFASVLNLATEKKRSLKKKLKRAQLDGVGFNQR